MGNICTRTHHNSTAYIQKNLLEFWCSDVKRNGIGITKQELKYKRLSIQNETIIEDVDDIIVMIQNNSSSSVIIDEGSPVCYVIYLV